MTSSASCVVDNYLGLSSTCTGRIARIFAVVAICSFTYTLSSAIASSVIYLFDSRPRAKCSAAALSSFSIISSIVGIISLIAAIGISCRLCSNYNAHSSSVSPIPLPDIIVIQNLHDINPDSSPSLGVNSNSSPSYNVESS